MSKRTRLGPDVAPYGKNGDLMEWPGYGEIDWRRNDPFEVDWMRLERIERGRSAARFIWVSREGPVYPMFMVDMLMAAQTGLIQVGGIVWRGTWYAVKRGTNYGIVLHDGREKKCQE